MYCICFFILLSYVATGYSSHNWYVLYPACQATVILFVDWLSPVLPTKNLRVINAHLPEFLQDDSETEEKISFLQNL